MSRGALRRFSALAIACALAGSAMASAPAAPAHYRFRLGDDEIVALSDGSAVRPLKEVIPTAPGADAAATTTIPINAFVVKTAGHLILVDAGAGSLLGPTTGGHLMASLRAAGFTPDQFDALLLTHAHPDHIGGLSANGAPLFTRATLYIDRRDIFGPQPEGAPAEPPKQQALRRFQQLMIRPYEAAGRLHVFDGATALFPGVRSLPVYGHSPGHSAYMITSKGRQLLLWGDVVHVAAQQFDHPELIAGSDFNAIAAAKARSRLFSDAAKPGVMVGGAHLPFPGIGHVQNQAGHFVWVPIIMKQKAIPE